MKFPIGYTYMQNAGKMNEIRPIHMGDDGLTRFGKPIAWTYSEMVAVHICQALEAFSKLNDKEQADA